MTQVSPFPHADWISSSVVGGVRTVPPVPYFRKEFSCPKKIRSARLTITALGIYEAEINGKPVGDRVFAPGWTEYSKRVQYQTYDVTRLIKKGGNAFGAILGDGWYCGAIGWLSVRQNYGDRPKLMAELSITYSDGSTETVSTDETWKTSTGPILESDFLGGESYDARLEFGDWSKAGYDDSGWQDATKINPPQIELNLSEAPPVRRVQEFKPKKNLRSAPSSIWDFEQNFTGRVRIKVKAREGVSVKLRFAEILNPDGSLYTENLRSARSIDYYTCKGDGVEVWEPRFTFHGFRYVEAEWIKQPQRYSDAALGCDFSIEITGVVLHSDTPQTGDFACSNKLLNQLQSNIQWGQRSNFLEVPTDCPQRDERLGWTGDAQVFVRTAAFNMDVRLFFHKWVRDIRDAQSPQGGVPSVIPNMVVSDEDGGPAWSDAAVICPWTIYLCYGDKKILEEHYDSMSRYIDFTGKKRSLNHIRIHPDLVNDKLRIWQGYGDWLALDGGGKVDGITPKDLIGTAFYAYDASLMSRIALILGRAEDSKKYLTLRNKIVAAFQERFVTPEGFVVSGTQTAYVLALHFGLLPETLRPIAARELVRDIQNRGFHIATGFVGTPYILDVLEQNGYLDVAYKLLEQESFPSWLFPVKNGATTIWERWDGWTPDKGVQDKGMNSYNHYAYGAVGAWMVKTVAGLEIDETNPGYKNIVFKPRPGGSISWAEASLKTERGEISIHWEKKGNALLVDLQVPNGSTATLLPPDGLGKPRKLPAGKHRLNLK